MNIGAVKNSQQSFSSLKINVKDTGDDLRKEQLESLKKQLPELQKMPEIDEYAINIVGKGGDGELDSYLLVSAKRPSLFKPQKATIEYTKGSVQSAIQRAIEYLHEKEDRKENGINFRC